ncbi:MAG: EpsI family protein [Acidobacteria bacterium]|nr:MAG: EpsI family protein [Acidobacteriota bacterium]PYQ90824.1 MAG: EpsI family protein [Acidobacteriota bacterium]PYR12096.1 MAG: EpsI family protein [Acidobacteriota bacterium]
MMARRLAIVAALMLAVGAFLRVVSAADLVPDASGLNALPMRIDQWHGRDLGRFDHDIEAVLQADTYTMRRYTRDAIPVDLFVAYYATQRTGHTIHSPLNCLPGTGWEWVDRRRERIRIGPGRDIEVNRNIARKNGEQDLVYYWYQSHGRTIASEYRNRLMLVHDALTLHRSDGALVRVTAPIIVGATRAADLPAFIRALYPVLTRHLPE